MIGRQERYVYFFLSPSNVVLPLNRQRIPKVSTRGGTENPILEHRLLDVDRYPAEEGEQRNTGSEKDSLEESRVELIESIKRSVLTDTSGNLHQPIMERGRLGVIESLNKWIKKGGGGGDGEHSDFASRLAEPPSPSPMIDKGRWGLFSPEWLAFQ